MVNPLMGQGPQGDDSDDGSAPPDGDALRNAAGAPSATPAGPGRAAPNPIAEHDFLSASMQKLKDAMRKTEALRKGLDRLMTLRDTVTPEDLTEEAARLVGVGVSPTVLASLIGQAPQNNGEVLSGWLMQQEQQLTQYEQGLAQQVAVTRYALGNSSMRLLAMSHMIGQGYGVQPQSNPMMPMPQGVQ